jgi:cytochrome c oxidase subunit II
MKNIPAPILTLVIGIVVTLISLWVGQNQHLLPEQVSEQAPLVDNLFTVMVIIGTAIFLLVEGALLLFMIQFRQRPGDDSDGSPIEGNIPLEIVWTAIPSIIVIGLGIYSVEVYAEMGGFSPNGGSGGMVMAHSHGGSHNHTGAMGSALAASLEDMGDAPALDTMDMEDMGSFGMMEAPKEPKPVQHYGLGAKPGQENTEPDVTVNVTGMQFAWIFNYPKEGVYTGELHIPVGKRVLLNLEATDVIHSFWLPQFRLKQDVLPGEKAELQFVATKTGTYPIVCAELCGSYHGGMRSTLVIHEPDEYQAWVEENRLAQGGEPQVPTTIAQLSPGEFIAPYGEEMGVTAELLAQLQDPELQPTGIESQGLQDLYVHGMDHAAMNHTAMNHTAMNHGVMDMAAIDAGAMASSL